MIIGAMPPESQHRCHGVEVAYDRLSDIRRRGICLSGGLAASRSVHLSQCALSRGSSPRSDVETARYSEHSAQADIAHCAAKELLGAQL